VLGVRVKPETDKRQERRHTHRHTNSKRATAQRQRGQVVMRGWLQRTHTRARTHTLTHTCIYGIYGDMVFMYACMYVYMCMHIYVYMYIYIVLTRGLGARGPAQAHQRGPVFKEKQATHAHTTRTTPHNTRQEQHHKRPHKEPPQSLNNDRRWRGDGAGGRV